MFFFFNDTATTEIYTLSLHDALPILIKQKKDGFYFRLNSREVNAEYRLINTRDKEWLLDRLDQPQVDWLRGGIEPMLAETRDKPFDSDDYIYEVKWDGIRALISLDEE